MSRKGVLGDSAGEADPPDTTCELMVVMATLPCCRVLAGTTMPEGLTELETAEGAELCRSSWKEEKKKNQRRGCSLNQAGVPERPGSSYRRAPLRFI